MLEHWCHDINKCWNHWPPPRVANWLPKFNGTPFLQPWVPIHSHKVQHLLVTWGRLKSFFFSILALTSSVKPLGLISIFASIGGMLDLSWTLALTPSVKWAFIKHDPPPTRILRHLRNRYKIASRLTNSKSH